MSSVVFGGVDRASDVSSDGRLAAGRVRRPGVGSPTAQPGLGRAGGGSVGLAALAGICRFSCWSADGVELWLFRLVTREHIHLLGIALGWVG